jgi:RsiW-degrading membrane proteinase PrsW (M82 family)
VELAASVGFIETTPALNASMSHVVSPWLFFRLFSFSIGAFFIFFVAFIMVPDTNLIPGLIVIGSFAIPTSILALFFEWNTPKNVSIVLLARFLIAGSALAILSALYFYTWGGAIGVRPLIIAGPVEETAKLLAVVYLTRSLDRARYRYTLNGILFGAAVGAGFAAFESAGFACQSLLNDGVVGATVSIVVRGMLSPFGHIIWTAISGGMFWLRRKAYDTVFATLIDWRFLAVFSIPVALHTLWDNAPSLPYGLNFIFLGAIGWAVVFALLEVGYHEVARYSKMQKLTSK